MQRKRKHEDDKKYEYEKELIEHANLPYHYYLSLLSTILSKGKKPSIILYLCCTSALEKLAKHDKSNATIHINSLIQFINEHQLQHIIDELTDKELKDNCQKTLDEHLVFCKKNQPEHNDNLNTQIDYEQSGDKFMDAGDADPNFQTKINFYKAAYHCYLHRLQIMPPVVASKRVDLLLSCLNALEKLADLDHESALYHVELMEKIILSPLLKNSIDELSDKNKQEEAAEIYESHLKFIQSRKIQPTPPQDSMHYQNNNPFLLYAAPQNNSNNNLAMVEMEKEFFENRGCVLS